MKLLTNAFASYADADRDFGFEAPEFALVTLGSTQAREELLRLRDLTATIAEARPTFSPEPKNRWSNYLVYEVKDGFAEFFNDRHRSVVGPYLDSTANVEGFIKFFLTPLVGCQCYCLVSNDFSVLDPEDNFSCATRGENGPVWCYTDTELMVSSEGFWFTHGVNFFSAKIMTALIPWSVLEEREGE